MPYYQLAAAPTQVAAMLPAIGGMRVDKLEVNMFDKFNDLACVLPSKV